MHEAYEPLTILEKFPLYIESITAYDENLVVGTKQGHLLMYSIGSDSTNRIKINLLRSNKNFSRKPIYQVAVVPEHQILISLSDQEISVHDLNVFNFPLLASLPKTKGAVAFDLDVKHHISLTGETQVTVRLVVAVRRKLQLYYLKSRQFHELREDLTLHDSPKCLIWSGEAVTVGFKHDYWIVKLTGEQKELFATGKAQEPLIMKMPDDSLALARDEKTILVDAEGNAMSNSTLEWPEQPTAITYDEPYMIAVMSKCVQIQSFDPKLSIQNLTLDKPRLITSTINNKNQKQVFVASVSHIWCLSSLPISQQIPHLLSEKQFQLALKLAELWRESSVIKSQMKQHIEKLHAVHLFCEGHFSEAVKLFIALNTDLLFVIGLCPGLVPEEYRSRLPYPHPIPQLEEDILKEALLELIHFLLQMRHKLVSEEDNERDSSGSPSIKSKSQKLQIIDTTLLKCYLKTNDSLIEPLLRMPDSRVSVEEAERVFRQTQKYKELVLLLQTKGLHSRAVQLLLRHSKRKDSPLFGHMHTVKYLQEMGPNHIELIFEYGGWVLKSFPEDGLTIFTGEGSTGEVELLPRPRVLNFIRKTNKALVIPYLEYVIWEWGDTTPLLHNELIHQYRDILINSTNSIEGDEYSQVRFKSEIREKLQKFLRTSTSYTAASILVHFPQNELLEEKAILLGRLGQHQQGLKIYIDTLEDLEGAIEYCHSHYSPTGHGSKVYITLIKLLITSSTSNCSSRNGSPCVDIPKLKNNSLKNEDIILNILKNYAHCIDVEQALKYLPDDMSTNLLKSYIHKSLIHLSTISKENKMIRGLAEALGEQAKSELSITQMRKIEVNDHTICSVCFKRFTTSCAFALGSRGEIFHYSCKDQKLRR